MPCVYRQTPSLFGRFHIKQLYHHIFNVMTRPSVILQDGYTYNTRRETSSLLLIAAAALPATAHLSAPSLTSKMTSTASETPFQPSHSVASKTYLDSPIRTLCESIKDPGALRISIHDLMEAYAVLSTRIRIILNQDTCTTGLPIHSLAGLAEFSLEIMNCISRDIQRPLPSPFDSQPQQNSSSYLYYDAATDLEDIQITMDNISLCHYALRFASDIFAFSMLYSIFPGKELHCMRSSCSNSAFPFFR